MAGRKKAGGVLCFLFSLCWPFSQRGLTTKMPKVAVLPFVMHGQQDVVKTQKSIDEVFTRLGAREGMKLIDPQEVQKAAGGSVSSEGQARSIGSRLGAAYAVFGSLNQIGNTISIDATLVDVSGQQKAGRPFSRRKRGRKPGFRRWENCAADERPCAFEGIDRGCESQREMTVSKPRR